jgi:hypothetical protein
VQGWRRIAIVGVLAWIVAVAFWASRPWTDTVTVRVPKGSPPESVRFDCGRLFGGGGGWHAVIATPKALRNLAHRPCTARGERRVVAVLDLAVGVVALAVLLQRLALWRPSASAAASEA